MAKTMSGQLNRRALLTALAAGWPRALRSADEKLPPMRPLTRGPKFHWFGYYDKLQLDPTSRYVLGMEVSFEHRSPRPEDRIALGVVDTATPDGNWREIGSTRGWNWQQGCMLQWVPGSRTDVIWNDRGESGFVSRVLNVQTGTMRTLPAPVYCVSPDARWALYPDFRRLNDCRPGYGYAGLPDPNRAVPAPEDAGIWRMNLKTGEHRLLIPFAQAARIPYAGGFPADAKHWFNHLLYSTDGSRFIFLHRWRAPNEPLSTFHTRLFTAAANGTDLYVLDPYGKTSHFVWRDPQHVMAWAWHPSHGERFYLYRDKTDQVEVMGPDVMTVNGHNTYVPQTGNRWVLNDTYPDAQRLQHPYLFDTATGRRVPLGHFFSPPVYTGEWRCDTHPRCSPDGTKVCIDSAYSGGRQMYLIDIDGIVRSRKG